MLSTPTTVWRDSRRGAHRSAHASAAHGAGPVLVIGAGPSGLAAAAALKRYGLDAVVLGRRPVDTPERPDRRTAALFLPAIRLLETCGAWERLVPACEPLRGIRLIDATGALLAAPTVVFHATEIGHDAFGWNVPNPQLVDCLLGALGIMGVPVFDTDVISVEPAAEAVVVRTADGETHTGALVVAADGRHSVARSAAAIESRAWSYDQVAITAIVSHTQPHAGISTEWHRTAGPLTLVPMPGNVSSLVWVERPAIARRILDKGAVSLKAALERHVIDITGPITEVSTPRTFPLSGLVATSFGKQRIALVGEAAHVMPPIGAQGLNLGLRDVAQLADVLAGAKSALHDIGSDGVLEAYSVARRRDVESRTGAVDLLNRSLLTDIAPASLARGAGLHLVRAVPLLRRQLMRLGMAPPGPLPSLMRDDAGVKRPADTTPAG